MSISKQYIDNSNQQTEHLFPFLKYRTLEFGTVTFALPMNIRENQLLVNEGLG